MLTTSLKISFHHGKQVILLCNSLIGLDITELKASGNQVLHADIFQLTVLYCDKMYAH